MLIGIGLAAIAALIALAYSVRNVGRPSTSDANRKTVPAWLGGLIAFVMGAAWFTVIGQQFVPHPVQPFWIPFAAGIAWAAVAFFLFVRWSSSAAWTDAHRYAVAVGATLACMVAPYLTIAGWPKFDVVGLLLFDLITLGGFTVLGKKVLAARSQAINW